MDLGISTSAASSTGAQQSDGPKFYGIGGSVGFSTTTVILIVAAVLVGLWFFKKK
jgi:hypothetical protein